MREGFVKFVATWSKNVQDVIVYTVYIYTYILDILSC